VAERPRILILGEAGPAERDWLRGCRPEGEVVTAGSWAHGLEMLRQEHFDAVVANPTDPSILESFRNLRRSERILATMPDGVAVVDFDLKIRWANPAFEAWCGGPVVGRGFYEALGSPRAEDEGADYCPFHTALASRADGQGGPVIVSCLLHCRGNRHLDMHISAIRDPDARHPLFIALGRDVTALVQQEQKLEALHKAGRELVPLAAEQLAEMSVAERIDLLKHNIRRLTRDLLHYEVIEIRMLDRRTGRLTPLLQDGMGPEAAERELIAETEGQGVTGWVAATGKSFLCSDTSHEPLYLPGAPGARSSLTVPLVYDDGVIGTVNVESPRSHAFGEDDQKFLELFSHEIAAALHTLELLSAEQRSATTQSLEAVSREVALPVDDILAAATSILERYIGHDPEMADKLRRILAGARSIKACIQQVGEDIAPATPPPAKAPVPPSLKGLRVLVADNDERVRRAAHGLLGRWGCVVETARDGREAVTMARLGAYDAILADINLPDLPGDEVYRQVSKAQSQARVVLMTGYGYDPKHTLVKARQEGLRFVLFKPFRVDQLMQVLATPDPPPTGRKKDEG
jgi:CheY-like chemotaxis protein/GAF domain-containing protein/PAS domain-containing protein